MTDKELLELAAKAVGLDDAAWNPLENDGDAFRLMMDLKMCVERKEDGSIAIYIPWGPGLKIDYFWIEDKALTRRTIVHIAAEVARGMK